MIRAALYSDSSNLWTEAGLNLGEQSIFFDAGDKTPRPNIDMFDAIEQSITTLLCQNLKPIALGGDHSVTYPIIKAFAKKYPKLDLLHFDAHPDLYDEFQGSRYSHACPFARIMEERLARRLVQVGIRTMNGRQRGQAQRFGVEVIEMKDWSDDLALEFDAPLYISFDVDSLDPAFAPGVSHREPGGFSTRQVLRAIQTLKASVVGADLVEFNPKMDVSGVTGMVCAKVLKEMAAKMLGRASA